MRAAAFIIGFAALAVTACGDRAPESVAVKSQPAYLTTTLASGLNNPWGMAFLPDAGILITEKYAGVKLFQGGKLTDIPGAPKAFADADSGLLDIALDPDFAANRMVYLAFAEGDEAANHTALYRARFENNVLAGGEVIFRNTPDKAGAGHPGGRIVFLRDKTLLLTLGDGYDYKQQAQDVASGLGKIVRLNRDGSIPTDNPKLSGGKSGIYSYGHRNPQGLVVDPKTGTVWEHEHGPRGGDEINVITAGANYGWPKTTHGIDYDGNQISKLQTAEGVTDPILVWVPSIAPSGLTIYRGDKFAEWNGDLLAGALAGKHLRRIRMRGGKEVLQEILLRGLDSRIRDVRTGPDGAVYLLTDGDDGKLIRLDPGAVS